MLKKTIKERTITLIITFIITVVAISFFRVPVVSGDFKEYQQLSFIEDASETYGFQLVRGSNQEKNYVLYGIYTNNSYDFEFIDQEDNRLFFIQSHQIKDNDFYTFSFERVGISNKAIITMLVLEENQTITEVEFMVLTTSHDLELIYTSEDIIERIMIDNYVNRVSFLSNRGLTIVWVVFLVYLGLFVAVIGVEAIVTYLKKKAILDNYFRSVGKDVFYQKTKRFFRYIFVNVLIGLVITYFMVVMLLFIANGFSFEDFDADIESSTDYITLTDGEKTVQIAIGLVESFRLSNKNQSLSIVYTFDFLGFDKNNDVVNIRCNQQFHQRVYVDAKTIYDSNDPFYRQIRADEVQSCEQGDLFSIVVRDTSTGLILMESNEHEWFNNPNQVMESFAIEPLEEELRIFPYLLIFNATLPAYGVRRLYHRLEPHVNRWIKRYQNAIKRLFQSGKQKE